jgi:hypothetical protein
LAKRLIVTLLDDRTEQHVEGDAADTLEPGVDRCGQRREARLRDIGGSEGNERSPEQDGAVGPQQTRRDMPRLTDEDVVVDPVDGRQEEADQIDRE